jgi:Tol biopolymer transport system component
MPANPIQLLGAGLVVTVGLAATSGAVSAPATGSRLAADGAQGKSKIAFISRGLQRRPGLYVVSADGSGQRRLTGPALVRTPAWSPDGRRIAFESVHACRSAGNPARCDRSTGVYVVNADGSFRVRLARHGTTPAWSPDGRRIAFFSGVEIYLMNADGTEHQALAKPLEGRSLAWSPDGRKLAFFGAGGCQACFNLYVVNSDGSGLRKLTGKLAAGAGPGRGPASDPAWSPDGQTIAFVGLNASVGEPIYVVKADGSGLRNLTPKPVGTYASPAWSPDGRKIAFVNRDGNSEVYVMNANGSGQRSLTRNPAFDDDPAWSPDGRLIAFRSTRDGNTDIYVMNADGSGQRNLTRSPANEGRFAWAPGRSKQGAS